MKLAFTLIRSVIALCLAIAASAGTASYIVDTGPGPSPVTGDLGLALSTSATNGSFQYLGATFDVSSETVISAVEAWVGVHSFSTGGISFSLYASATPGGTPLFSQQSPTLTATVADWVGVQGLNWMVSPGVYTLVLRGTPGFAGYMPRPTPNPLQVEWVSNDTPIGANNWLQSNIQLGYRVSAIPEPTTPLLWVLGISTVAVVTRHTRSRVTTDA